MHESNERKWGVVLSYVSIIMNTLIQLLYTPLLIKKLGQSEYGLYSLVASIIGYLTIMDFGFGNAIVVYTAKYRAQGKSKEEKKLHGMFNLVFKIIGVIAALLGIILYFNVENIFGAKMTDVEVYKMQIMMLILSFNLFITFNFAIYNSIISAYEKFTFQKIISIIHSLLKPLLMIPLLFLGYKSISLCLIITFTNIIALLSNYFYCRKELNISIKFLGFDKKIFKTIISYSIWIFLGVIVDKVNYSVDQIVLGAVSGTIAVSIYSVATTFNTVFINISTAISGVMLPKMTKLVATNATPNDLTNEMIKVGRLQNYIIFLACSGFILFGRNFIISWVGEEYTTSYYVTLLLIVPACVPLIQNTALSIMQAMNKYKFKSISTSIMAIFNIIISIFLAKLWGPVGAALGTCIALVICNIILINLYYIKNMKLQICRFWKEIIKQSIPFIIPIVSILIITYYTEFTGFKAFILYGGIYSILYFIVVYFLSMNEYEKKLVSKFINKMTMIKWGNKK